MAPPDHWTLRLVGSAMKLTVIVPTLGRKQQIPLLLAHLERQRRLPDEVVISAPDETHVPNELQKWCFPVSLVLGKRGLSAQRNNALSVVLGRCDLVTFFDDDFVPAEDYLKRVCSAFEEHPDWAVVMGNVFKDGATSAGLTWEEGLAAIKAFEAAPRPEHRISHHVGAYGCNMTIRAEFIGELRFDERLVLYGWQEDIDFTSRLRRRGPVVEVSTIAGVHLGLKSGRVSGERFGYSQVANPIYLIQKGSVPASFALPLMGRNIAANLIRSLFPEAYVDRRGRLRGNLLALAHVLRGRIEPEHILNL